MSYYRCLHCDRILGSKGPHRCKGTVRKSGQKYQEVKWVPVDESEPEMVATHEELDISRWTDANGRIFNSERIEVSTEWRYPRRTREYGAGIQTIEYCIDGEWQPVQRRFCFKHMTRPATCPEVRGIHCWSCIVPGGKRTEDPE